MESGVALTATEWSKKVELYYVPPDSLYPEKVTIGLKATRLLVHISIL